MPSSSIAEAIAALSAGGKVLVVDDEDRENEGDLIMAAEHATTGDVAFFLEHTSGFLCVAIDEDRADDLELDLMVAANTESQGTAFLVSVDYRHGTTTGISAGDRAKTIRALADPRLRPADLARPGHVMPLRAKPGGVLRRTGHTEAGVDLCRMAGLSGAALLCEIVTPDRRHMMRRPELDGFAARHDIPMISIAALVEWMRDHGGDVRRTGQATIPTDLGAFRAITYQSEPDGVEHLALAMGEVEGADDVLVRLHSECLTGDLIGSLRCDCGAQLRMAMETIAAVGRGVIVYMRGHEGRGIGLGHKLRAYQLQQYQGMDTIEANRALGLPVDSRDYIPAARILAGLGITSVRLMTNNPDKCRALTECGITISERLPLEAEPNEHNTHYLAAKRDRMGHLLQQLA
ncbi:GTP cyclohydrolase II/3,4-dihydroxy 2-butanone 4-phosphate synthase/GTP cyclohydrolase II [Saccharopolyspora erythraea NRRL 2338]|uniref:Multifunctional fusion protein n=2 Tax=Saccharopolyspora erythraea TaxID=1836 RepID=A4FDE2_SACEN|nr:bifunctional 3,4-dihydroxy-2-butanone-4-phosphate synthase/GTP cyclohydrolase II [Saccharopolyspora erythraea]PFG95807.1 GTP cyclohydrolase II/3,4-dihydroxy 2-butanone 4-phosphate synthase/GTP cyclohydrolase II [Saccharopolyspora erythraea NRRL 2338]CAM02067.1 34-dihydroxy-2-butanone 4-phosphate synthase [Saccharopolyspora erythraea NRRL 2338]